MKQFPVYHLRTIWFYKNFCQTLLNQFCRSLIARIGQSFQLIENLLQDLIHKISPYCPILNYYLFTGGLSSPFPSPTKSQLKLLPYRETLLTVTC